MKTFTLILLCLIEFSCAQTMDKNLAAKDDVTYIKYDPAQFDFISIARDEKVKILSLTDTKNCDADTLLYKQVIGIRMSKRDTVRILIPCQELKPKHIGKTGYFRETTEDITKRYIYIRNIQVAYTLQELKESGKFKTCIGVLGFTD